MKKRVHHTIKQKTIVRSRKKTARHLHFHMIYLYSTMGIFGLTLLFAFAQTYVPGLQFHQAPTTVLGAHDANTSLFQQILALFFP